MQHWRQRSYILLAVFLSVFSIYVSVKGDILLDDGLTRLGVTIVCGVLAIVSVFAAMVED